MKGLGEQHAKIRVYIENPPPLSKYQSLTAIKPMNSGEIYSIAQQTGNHWRKIFNVYSKLIFELSPQQFTCWQMLRDEFLLQKDSQLALIFSQPSLVEMTTQSGNSNAIHIIMGKTYATKLNIAQNAFWLNEYFAIHQEEQIIVCPYFDYRQLSNIKITQLVNLIKQLSATF